MTPTTTRRAAIALAALAALAVLQLARWTTVPTGHRVSSGGMGRSETGAILVDRLTGRTWHIYAGRRTRHIEEKK